MVKFAYAGKNRVHDLVLGLFLPAGDLVMMHKQLRLFKELAEQNAG